MSAKTVCLATLVTALVGLGAVRGQYPTSGDYTPTSPGAIGGTSVPTSVSGALATRPGDSTPPQDQPSPSQPVNLCLSDWIVGGNRAGGCGPGCSGAGCCGPVGGNGPVQMEIYLQQGVAIPFSDGVWGHTLQAGWDIQGGGRSLFFNPEQDAAWVVDISLSNNHYHGENPAYQVPLTHILIPTPSTGLDARLIGPGTGIVNFVPQAVYNKLPLVPAGSPTLTPAVTRTTGFKVLKLGTAANAVTGSAGSPTTFAAPGVSIADLNETFANLGFGRDWYLFGQAPTYLSCAGGNCGDHGCGGVAWRVGVDGGGRYGTAKLELHDIRHRTDTIAGLFVAAHSDLEIPCGCCIFQAGLRVEYDYTWMDILQTPNDTDLENFNVLLSAGVRF
jgi:hypothetical protein